MTTFKSILDNLKSDEIMRDISEEEKKYLKQVLLSAYKDITYVFEKYSLTHMLIGGSALGAVRHKGFIPWDDDLDIAMPRRDFEKFKMVFSKSLGDKYILSSPNYIGNARNRFPQILIKDTRLCEIENAENDPLCMIKIDLFVIENIPDNKFMCTIKGIWCSILMFIASYAATYQEHSPYLKTYMYKTKNGRKIYNKRIFWGKLFSFISKKTWYDMVDKACQYKRKTSFMGIPTGRGHYFGEIRSKKTFLPVSKGIFEGMEINLPGDSTDYLTNLYGDYTKIPPENKRERHLIVDLKFKMD